MLGTCTRRLVASTMGVFLVGALAGCGGGGSSSQGYQEPKGAARETVKIEAGNFYFKPKNLTTKAGIVKLELDSAEGTHTLVFDHGKVPGYQLEVDQGQSNARKIDLKPGKYVFYCDILGHRAQGMEGTITVK